ncbi:MAG: hypothetical protein ACKVOW_06985 [Chitinophagaceae bacterium]
MLRRYLGIWMDQTSAHLTNLTVDPVEVVSIESVYTSTHIGNTFHESKRNVEYQKSILQQAFFKQLSDRMLNYDEVLLFGPSNAKSQLLNFFRVEQHINKIKIHVKNATNMTEQQEHAFIRRHFLSNYLPITYYKIKTNETCNKHREFRTWRQNSKSELYN